LERSDILPPTPQPWFFKHFRHIAPWNSMLYKAEQLQDKIISLKEINTWYGSQFSVMDMIGDVH